MSTLIAGHRGVAGTHPENTLVSIQAAKKSGPNLGRSRYSTD